MRLVLDTDVIVSAIRSSKGASAALLLEIGERRHATLLLSVVLALEYEAVCVLPEHRIVTGLTEEEARRFVGTIIAISEPVKVRYSWRPQLHDPGDEMVLEAAINGGADWLVSFNRKHFGNLPERFGIELLSPAEALWRTRA
jgi:predicted nucleic acid-binding protein